MQRMQRLCKAIIYIIEALVLCLSLSGCVSPAEFTQSPASQPESPSEAAVLFPDYVYDQESLRYSSGPRASVKEDGYYLVINYALYFYDIQSDMLFPLCTKASCIHKDETCDAYVNNHNLIPKTGEHIIVNGWRANASDYRIYYYQDYLYTIGDHVDRGAVLLQYSPDFSERKEIAELGDYEKEPREVCLPGTILFHHDHVYYLTCLYDAETAWGNPEYRTTYTMRRIKLEEKAEPKALYSFDFIYSSNAFRTGAFGDEICYMLDISNFSQRTVKNEEGMEIWAPEFNGGSGRLYRYDEKEDQSELAWSYDGDHEAVLFDAEGAIPRNMASMEYLVNSEGDYVYFAGYPEKLGKGLRPTKIAFVNLTTREGNVLYETPYEHITQLRSDGKYYYFLEDGKGDAYLTAIDREGNLVRRYEIPLDEESKYVKEMEELGWPREEWTGADRLALLIADGRYIVLGGSMHQNLTSQMDGYDSDKYDHIDEGVGVIDTADFLSGKDVEIRQIYERTDPFR